MAKTKIHPSNLRRSLADLLGADYLKAVCEARAFADGADAGALQAIAEEQVDFYPASFRERGDRLADSVGRKVVPGLAASARGAGSGAFLKASHIAQAPLVGCGCLRIGEDGVLYLISKSEHYHASLGHDFPGYRLIENAKKLGVTNITHNNTRGHITRLLEQELVRTANGLKRGDRKALERVLESRQAHTLNRVVNLETGSLAVEAALKMMLARFYRLHHHFPLPPYHGRVPVFLVMADNEGGRQANYHGTTLLTQAMRGMWPELYAALDREDLFLVQPVRLNDSAHFEEQLLRWESGKYKVAGFFHELILMNYGGIRLKERFLNRAYELCRQHDVPTIVDEIQSCIWSPELFLFREYGLKPDFVSVGKGFPGGQYPASKILFSAHLDNLDQFGALVTNGQEELASLAYLITMEFVQANAGYVRELGEYYEKALRGLAKKHPRVLDCIEGQRHLSALFFRSEEKAVAFIKILNEGGIDISAQTYKAKCPPSALTKLPLTATPKIVDVLVARMDAALKSL
jgi:4-aminobutyrate aminotransferase-like enzyme